MARIKESAPLTETGFTNKVMPRWTERVTTQFGGRDPLGLSRVSNIITDYLLTGIITTTDRARYYSFYCWALWHIASDEKPRRYQDFVDSFRRREAVMALATIAHNPETSPVGVQSVSPRLQADSAEGELHCDFRVLPSNPLGGYGQYYAGSLYNLRLVYRTEDGIDRVSTGDAEVLSSLFHTTVKNTPYIEKRLFSESHMPMDDFRKTQRYLSLDSLLEPFCSRERLKLIDVFFGFGNRDLADRDIRRRHSLAQILFTVSQYEKHGFQPNLQDLDWHLVYSPYYYNELGPIGNWHSSYACPKELELCKSLWRQFCLQQFFSQAMESLMCSVLETVTIESVGLKIDGIVARILQPEFYDVLKDFTERSCLTPHDLLLSFGVKGVPTEATSTKAQKELSLTHPRSEAQILKANRITPEAMAAQAVLILSILYLKWRGIRNDIGFDYVDSHAAAELWTKPILFWLDCWLEEKASWSDILRIMIENYVLNQHDRIMYEKGRLNSCWLHRVESRILKDQDYSPRWRSSRHTNAVRILCDLGLLKTDEAGDIWITDEGKVVLKSSLEWHK